MDCFLRKLPNNGPASEDVHFAASHVYEDMAKVTQSVPTGRILVRIISERIVGHIVDVSVLQTQIVEVAQVVSRERLSAASRGADSRRSCVAGRGRTCGGGRGARTHQERFLERVVEQFVCL